MLVKLLVVALGMAAKDFLGTMLVVAEARGRDRLAGVMDALGDVASVVCAVVGVDAINKGVNLNSALVLGVMCTTSYNVTRRTTRLAKRLRADSEVK